MTDKEKKKSIWTRKKVYELITLYQMNECLWNCSQRSYKDRDKRVEVVKEICATMGITKDQFARKIHNLRNQYIFELRKLQKMKSMDDSSADECLSKWEYFDRLQFLRKYITTRPSFGENDQKLQLFDDESSIVFKCKEPSETPTTCSRIDEVPQPQSKFEPSLESPIIFEVPKVIELSREREGETFQEHEVTPPKKTNVELGGGRDESEVFGQFVANELRSLNSETSRKRLKRKIMQAIVDVGNEDDGININIKLT